MISSWNSLFNLTNLFPISVENFAAKNFSTVKTKAKIFNC